METPDLALVAALFGPLFLGLAVNGVCMKKGWLAGLRAPIDGGRTLRGRRLFGANKTWRGIVAVALGTAAGFAVEALFHARLPASLAALPAWGLVVLGLALGAVAMLSELPNSLLKRQLGVGPGEAGRGWRGVLFYVFDQVDFLIGGWLVAMWVVRPTASRLAWSLAFVFVVHQAVTVAGYRMGLRSTAR